MTAQNGRRETWDTGEPVITPVRRPAPPCQEMWCTALADGRQPSPASGWLWSESRRSWTPCCTDCLLHWRELIPEGQTLITQPMYQPAAPVAPAPAAAPAPARGIRGLVRSWTGYRAQSPVAAGAIETAALFGAWGAVHRWVKEGQRRDYESAMHIAPRNNVQAGIWTVEARQEAARVRHQQDQIAADLHTLASQGSSPSAPTFTRTRRSDIYGNLI